MDGTGLSCEVCFPMNFGSNTFLERSVPMITLQGKNIHFFSFPSFCSGRVGTSLGHVRGVSSQTLALEGVCIGARALPLSYTFTEDSILGGISGCPCILHQRGFMSHELSHISSMSYIFHLYPLFSVLLIVYFIICFSQTVFV